jgi:Calcineurin-like phosphoesterase
VTFAVVSDMHFGFGAIQTSHQRLIGALGRLPGKRYPYMLQKAAGPTVPELRGLLITGDLTEWGTEAQWAQFVSYYGRPGGKGALAIPTFEVIGNHDRASGTYVESQVAARHGGRFYSFQWGDVHFLALGEAPDQAGLAFVEKDLANVSPDVPLILYFHLPFSGPWAKGWWFADGDYPEHLHALIKDRPVLAIFHGHHHATGHYKWRGIDVFKPGPVKDGGHDLAVVHVSDKSFSLATYNYETETWGGAFQKVWKR